MITRSLQRTAGGGSCLNFRLSGPPPLSFIVRMKSNISPALVLPLLLLAFVGWPFLSFAFFRWRKRRSRIAAFSLSISTGLGAVWLATSLSDIAFSFSRRGGAVSAVLSALVMGIAWLTPYIVLLGWGATALRRKHETS